MTGPTKDRRNQPYLPAELPFQVPVAAQHQANWPAFDVPRTWDIVRPENDELGWIQVGGFQQLADVLFAHCDALTQRRNELANAWQGPAAEAALNHIDQFIGQLQSDARCAATTAHGLNGIMETQAAARTEVSELKDRWRDVTTDWKPEWWDSAAKKLNDEAVAIMDKADRAIRDHRTRIILPDDHQGWRDDVPPPSIEPPPAEQTSKTSSTGAPSRPQPVPPIPGYSATYSSSSGSSEDGDFDLASGPGPNPAKPGQPVSMLPIPPGNPYAPQGGAYVLPGPGVGAGGYIVPMPQPRTQGAGGGYGAIARAGTAGAPGASGGAAMMPMAMGGAPASAGKNPSSRGGRTDTVWEIQQGVPPVIEGIDQRTYVPGQASPTQEAEFQDWFAQLAYPWRNEERGNGIEPQVVLRKVKS